MAPPPPPPPPPRQRGSSRGSIDAPNSANPRRQSADSVGMLGKPLVEEPAAEAEEARNAWNADAPSQSSGAAAPPLPTLEAGKAEDILADLDALQREVDALIGKQ
jgi:hypothetical protein